VCVCVREREIIYEKFFITILYFGFELYNLEIIRLNYLETMKRRIPEPVLLHISWFYIFRFHRTFNLIIFYLTL